MARVTNPGNVREKEWERKQSREQAWRLSPGKHGWLTDLSPRQPLTTHVALLGASTGSRGRPGKVGVCIQEASGRQGERVQS